MDIAEIIRRARGSRSQTWLAAELGVHQTTVSDWEKGRNAPRPDKFADIERLLDLEPGTLMAAQGYPVADGRPAQPPDLVVDLPDGGRLLVQAKSASTNNRRNRVTEAVGSMVGLAHERDWALDGSWPEVFDVGDELELHRILGRLGVQEVPDGDISVATYPAVLVAWRARPQSDDMGEVAAFGRLTPENRAAVQRIMTELLRAQGLDPHDPEVD